MMKPTMIKLTEVFKQALPVIEKIQSAGHEAYFVGGSIRDAILKLSVNDVDIATSAMPHEIQSIFKRTVDIGIEHGTVMVLWKGIPYEVTTFRTESTYADHRRPDSVTFVRSLKEDLKRRDFTMNAMALTTEGVLIDYFNGREAIENKVIQTVGRASERFNEDALRMMRAVRFQSQLGFLLEQETQAAIKEYSELLEKIAIERIQIEFEKLLAGNWRSMGLETMLQTGLYKYCPMFDQAEEALGQLSLIKGKTITVAESWALLCYFMERFTEKFDTQHFLKSWKLSNRLIHEVEHLLTGMKVRTSAPEQDSWYLFNYGLKPVQSIENIYNILEKENHLDAVTDAYLNLPIKEKQQLAITGNDLMNATDRAPGPWIGEAIQSALRAVVDEKVRNEKDELLSYLLK